MKWILLCLMLGLSATAHAAFEDTGTGARPTALGGTYVAIGDDVQSLMYNPAGLAKMTGKEVTSEYTQLYAGLDDHSEISEYFLGYGQRLRYGGTLALGWKRLALDDLYQERTLSLGYGEWITDRVAAGLALKQLYHAFGIPNTVVDNNGSLTNGTPDFFVQNGNSNTAYSADIGVLIRATDRHTVGLSIQDLNEPNIALSNAYRRVVNRTIRLGDAYRVDTGLTLGAAMTRHESLDNQMDTTWTGSAERWWNTTQGGIGMRGSLATGSRDFRQVAMGPAYRVNGFEIDYTTVFNLSGVSFGDTAGTHRFSLTYHFGEGNTGTTASPKAAPKRPEPPDDLDLLLESLSETTMPWDGPKQSAVQEKAAPKEARPAPPSPPPAMTHTPAPILVRPRPEDTEIRVEDLPQPSIPAAYVVQPGDTLMSIATKFYGDAEQWREIYALNSDRLGLGGFLAPGKVLFMPQKGKPHER